MLIRREGRASRPTDMGVDTAGCNESVASWHASLSISPRGVRIGLLMHCVAAIGQLRRLLIQAANPGHSIW